MKLIKKKLHLSATDIANHLSCAHLTQLEANAARGEIDKPYRDDAFLKRLIERGLKHEQSYVDALTNSGKSLLTLEYTESNAAEKTLNAMRDGVEVIVQGSLSSDIWNGRPDLLIRTELESPVLGDWSYEAVDTKLTRTTKAGTILQLCLYSDLLSELQGCTPELMTVVMPGEPFTHETHRVSDYSAYYRMVKSTLFDEITRKEPSHTYPDPVSHCDVCRWWKQCDDIREHDKHLSIIAGISSRQTRELNRQSINTLPDFATRTEPLDAPPKTGSVESFSKLHHQAKLQHHFRETKELRTRFLPVEPRRGLCKLPEPSDGDIFFDIEGDRFAFDTGLEYLFGYCISESGKPKYESMWALDQSSEKKMFETFIDLMMEKWVKYPDFHIYHYAHYEPTAMKRLAMQHATREDDVDKLLRAERFVDLYSVVKQSLQAGVDRYSIKNLEPFYEYKRDTALEDARRALREFENELDLSCLDVINEDTMNVVEGYNKDDCVSTLHLRDWLETLRQKQLNNDESIPRPELLDGNASEKIKEQDDESASLASALVAGLPDTDRNPQEQAKWLLAHLLDYFRREDKCVWWEYFRLHDLDTNELFLEKSGIAGLQFVSEVPGGPRDRNPTHQYTFPTQEAHFKTDAEVVEVGGEEIGTVSNFDLKNKTIDIKKKGTAIDQHPANAFVFDRVRPHPLPESILQFADNVVQNGTLHSAQYDLLAKQPPRLKSLKLPHSGEDLLSGAAELAADLDNSILPIQGPPGAGKTYLGSHLIKSLAERGFSIGVTAISHKVVTNLLSAVIKRSNGDIQVGQKMTKYPDEFSDDVQRLKKNDKIIDALASGTVVGGTAWLWANSDMTQQLDYLVIDEAGQMSLAVALAAARSCRNIILLGDPQQLEQPQLGSHPEGADTAALTHLLDGKATITDTQGLFLPDTWRLNPNICQYTSELFYESRLSSRPGLEVQALDSSILPDSGLCLITLEHKSNQTQSPEEVEAIVTVVSQITNGKHSWTDETGDCQPITIEDILIVAPYNAQVALLQNSLPENARVGTVDKFQGQEAAIVIYSATSSSVEDAPRGMAFLLNPNRLNVATSRARCLAVLVASKKLFHANCSTPEHIALVNGLCRFKELAQMLSTDNLEL